MCKACTAVISEAFANQGKQSRFIFSFSRKHHVSSYGSKLSQIAIPTSTGWLCPKGIHLRMVSKLSDTLMDDDDDDIHSNQLWYVFVVVFISACHNQNNFPKHPMIWMTATILELTLRTNRLIEADPIYPNSVVTFCFGVLEARSHSNVCICLHVGCHPGIPFRHEATFVALRELLTKIP